MKKSNYHIGHFVEKMALLFLILKGYFPVAVNYVTGRGTGAGEVDLIVKKGHTLVFVEVKKRQNLITSAEAITHKNQQRTARAAEAFLCKNSKYQNYTIRFDAILFGNNFWPKHIKAAWHL